MPKESQLPVDPNVKVPAAVARASALASEIHQNAYPGSTPSSPPTLPAGNNDGMVQFEMPAPPAAQPASPAPATPAPPAAPPAPPPAVQPPPPPLAVQPPPPPPPAPPAEPQPVDWEQRYHAMKGRFDQSQNVVTDLQGRVAELSHDVTQLVSQVRRPASPPPPPPRPLLTDKDRETYGEELIDFVQRAAAAAVAPVLTEVRAQNQQTRQQLQHVSVQSVYDALASAVPNWEEINSSPRFQAWTNLRDIYSGQVRKALLNAALQRADAPCVIAFFKGFLTEEQATGQLPAPQPASQPDTAPGHAPAVPLVTLAAPGRPSPAPGDTGTPSEKPIYTRAQVSAFYSLVRQGVYVGRNAEKDALEASIFEAQREGRIR